MEAARHIPVLVEEVIHWLNVRPEGIYVDATAGLGGHTAAIAQRLTTGLVIANDCDSEALEQARRNTSSWADRIRFRHGWFSSLPAALAEMGIRRVDGLLADLGASLAQLTGSRGFSVWTDGPLDMRFDTSSPMTADALVNTLNQPQLARLIRQQGEERRAEVIARAILRARPVRSAGHLARLIEQVAPRTGRLHPATRTFMALRRVVNREAEELAALLGCAPELAAGGGRLVVISFMSLEDRQVKQAFQDWIRQGRAIRLLKHVVRPSAEEVRNNPAARSARLRAIEFR